MPTLSVRRKTRSLSLAGVGSALTVLFLSSVSPFGRALPSVPSLQASDLRALDGDWIYLEDRTEGRALEQMGPPMGSKFTFKVEEGAVVLVWGHGGGGNRNVRVATDGTPTEIPGSTAGTLTRYRGSWKDGVFAYEIEFVTAAGLVESRVIKREFRLTPDGLVVRSNLELTPGVWSVGLFRHPQDIPMPSPAKATIADLAWIAGNWSGTRGTTGQIFFEERWSPPRGGSMFATSRTVNRDRLSMFEFLRIVEKDGGLVYVAQPNGAAPTEFILTEYSNKKAVFDNPRHDYPKRIVYELTDSGGLTATIGFMKGGTPGKFVFKREPG